MSRYTTAALDALRRRKRPVAGVVSAAAVGALALGTLGVGTATAHGMVTSGEIKNQTITQADVGQGGVSGSSGTGNNEIERQSVGQADVGKGGVSGTDGTGNSEIELGSVGEENLSEDAKAALKGEQGPPGEDGEDGQDGVSGYEVIGPTDARQTVAAGERTTLTVDCHNTGAEGDPDKVALSGGVRKVSGGGQVNVNQSHPSDISQAQESSDTDPAGIWHATSWTIQVTNTGDADITVQPYVLCAIAR